MSETIHHNNHLDQSQNYDQDGQPVQKIMSIEDIDPNIIYEQSIKTLLNSPRSLEACRRQGIDPKELDPIPEDTVREMLEQREKKKNIPKAIIEMRMQHYESKRKERIQLIREERQTLIDELEKGSKYIGLNTSNMSRSQSQGGLALQNNMSNTQSTIMNDPHNGSMTDRNRFLSPHSLTSPQFQSMSGTRSSYMQYRNPLSQTSGQLQSAMLEKERKELEKIRFRQKKDIEQMMEYELKMEQIRLRNEEKLRFQMEKEEKRRREIAKIQKEQEDRKRKEEERKKEKFEIEQLEQKRRAEETFKREQEMLEKQKLLEKQRKKEALMKEEERRKKQEEFNMQTEKILQEQQKQVDQRKQEIEKRDQERRDFLIRKQFEKQRNAQKKREETERKIEQTRQAAEAAIQKQRKEFEDRQAKVEEIRKQFETSRERERYEMAQKAMQKSMEIKKVIEQNNILSEQRKEFIRSQQRKAEERQQQLSVERMRSLEAKRKAQEEKERHSLDVRRQMESRESTRIDSIKRKRMEKDSVMMRTQSERDYQLMLKKEMEMIRREEKLENVERIAKAQEYKKARILDKIQTDNSRAYQLQREKEKLMETRFQVRREAERQKALVIEQFEQMKRRGKLDKKHLSTLGLSTADEIQEDPLNETKVKEDDLNEVRERQAKEMKQLLEQEKRAENDRLAKIQASKNDDERQALNKEHEKAKAISSDRIAKLQAKHQQEIRMLTGGGNHIRQDD